jgi:flagellar biosynthesis/type III secretory pathway protein FliH
MSLKGFLGLLAGTVMLFAPVIAFAQSPAWSRLPSDPVRAGYADESQGAYYEVRRAAYDQGYRDGARRGEEDARRGDRFGYQDERDFQRADRGYHRSLGDRDRYRQVFRDGFSAGYSAGYSRFSRYGGTGPGGEYGRPGPYGRYYSPALENGIRDGYEKGLEDARKNRSYDILRHSWYRSGDRDFERRYGSKEAYKDAYRRGFQQGYDRGFRERRYRW